MESAPRLIDNYEILDEIGRGGMAVVYRARDQRLDRDVALKLMHEHIADREESRYRFEREARAVARLQHPNIVQIFGFSSPTAERAYIACELIRGPTLRTFIEERGVPSPEVAALLGYFIAEGLHHAHEAGVIHRDVKPENVMITPEGELKLMDFGVARINDAQQMTTTGALLGSPAHMSPEVIEGLQADQRSDVFALGTTLYYLLTGELPFLGRSPAAVLNAILFGRYTPAEETNRSVLPKLARIVHLCLARRPDDRFESAGDVADGLREYLATFGIDDPEAAVRSYFADPERFEAELARDVREVLEREATAALEEGRPAVAVSYCDRILQTHPDDPFVRRLLAKLDERRRTRRLAIGSAIACLLAAVGFWIYGQLDPPSSPVPTQTTAPSPAARAASETVGGATGSAAQAAAETARAASSEEERRATAEALVRASDHARHAVALALAASRTGWALSNAIDDATTESERARRRLAANRARAERDGETTPGGGDDERDAEAAEPKPEQAETTDVYFRVWPLTAVVSVDGEVVGVASALRDRPVPITPGRHVVRARHPTTLVEATELIDVPNAGRYDLGLRVPWPPAMLTVQSNVPAVVWLDGEVAGRAGERIQVEIPGNDPTRRVALRIVPEGRFGGVHTEQTVLRANAEKLVTVRF